MLERPTAGGPANHRRPLPHRLKRQYLTNHTAEAGAQLPGQPCTHPGIVEVGLQRINIGWQAALLIQCSPWVLIGIHHIPGIQTQPTGQTSAESADILGRQLPGGIDIQTGSILPDRLPIHPPVKIQGPARQRLPRIPLALTEVQNSARSKTFPQTANQLVGQPPLVPAQRGGIPFGTVHVIHGNKGWLSTLGQAYIASHELGINLLGQLANGCPLFIGIGPSHPRVFVNTGHPHGDIKTGFTDAGHAGHRCGRRRQGRYRQRNVPFAGEQAGGGVDANPTGTGYVGFAPGMQIGEIDLRAGRAVQRLFIGDQLNQISGDKAGGDSEVTQ